MSSKAYLSRGVPHAFRNRYNSLKSGCYPVDVLDNTGSEGAYLADLTLNKYMDRIIWLRVWGEHLQQGASAP
jgi:hypothetical protein